MVSGGAYLPCVLNNSCANSFETYNPSTGIWTLSSLGLPPSDAWKTYPKLELISNFPTVPPGSPFPTADMVLLGFGDFYDALPANTNNTWLVSPSNPADSTPLASSMFERAEGNAIRVPANDPTFISPDRFLLVGGRDDTSADFNAKSEVEYLLDPRNTSNVWQHDTTAPDVWGDLTYSRLFCNTVILADGTILVVGGASRDHVLSPVGPIVPRKTPELLDPFNPTGWKPMAEESHRRLYHSVALLLPDGRVLSMGGQYGNWYLQQTQPTWGISNLLFESDAQIYSPPYLFKGQRPSFSDPPTAFGYGDAFDVRVDYPPGTSVDRFVLIRPGAVTHFNNFEQRYVPLAFTPVSAPSPLPNGWSRQTFNVSSPPHAYAAPPGFYMLFVLAAQGTPPNVDRIPSVARFVFVG